MLKEELADFIVGNKRLAKVVSNVDKNKELNTYWVCSNINALDRMGRNDHGATHVKISSRYALTLLRMLGKYGVKPSLVKDYVDNRHIKDYGLDYYDAEVIVFLATCLHDIGIVAHRLKHSAYNLPVALHMLDSLIDGVYNDEQKAIIKSEVLHAIVTNKVGEIPLTVESSVVRIADALDMAKGRAKISSKLGYRDEHKLSASSIERVRIIANSLPIVLEITMNGQIGLFQVGLLKDKLRDTNIENYFKISTLIV